jgi:hypothetical protein
VQERHDIISNLGESDRPIVFPGKLTHRRPNIEVVAPPERVYSCFVHGYKSLPVRIPA